MNSPDLKIMIVGRNGQVARELQERLAPLGSITCMGRPEIDLADLEGIRAAVRRVWPDVLVNAAAYTAVDLAESEMEIATKVNADGVRELAVAAKELRALFITYSSDYVFDGGKKTPYTEFDLPNPINVYGCSKLAGDRAVEQVGGDYLIFRTSWVYGDRTKNFLNTILKLARDREELRVIDDQIGAPTWCREIASATGQVIARVASEVPMSSSNRPAEKLGTRRGIYNMTAGGSVSWYGFAVAIVEEAKNRGICGGRLARITAIPASHYPTPARRPMNSRLSNEKLKEVFGVSLPHWKDSLVQVIERLGEHQENGIRSREQERAK